MGKGRSLLADAGLFLGTLFPCLIAAELTLRATGVYGLRVRNGGDRIATDRCQHPFPSPEAHMPRSATLTSPSQL